MADIEFNQAGLDAGIAGKIEQADKDIRTAHAGKPAADVEPTARATFARIGIDLGSEIKEYAESVEQNKPFQINLS